MLELMEAEQMLMRDHLTCIVFLEGKVVFQSKDSGLKPLLDYRATEPTGRNRILVDRVVGRAAAYLAVSMGIRQVVALSVCVGALDIFDQHAVQCTYRYVIRHVTDRSGHYQCVFDQVLENVRRTDQAVDLILRRWREMEKADRAQKGKRENPPPLHSYR